MLLSVSIIQALEKPCVVAPTMASAPIRAARARLAMRRGRGMG